MSVEIIPIENAGENGAFSFVVDLEGTDYQFDFQYNDRSEAWYFNLSDANGNILRAGIRCVVNFPLIRLLKTINSPPGELLIIDTTVRPGDPTLDTLGVDAFLTYVFEDQLL